MAPGPGQRNRCPHCGRPIPFPGNCRSRRCQRYAPLWAGDTRRRLFVNLDEYAAQDAARVLLVTVTAPGADVLPWDDTICQPKGPHRHSGPEGCRIRRHEAQDWNRRASARWTGLHQAAALAAFRLVGSRPRYLVGVWEMQHRGALHKHVVLGFTTPAEQRSAIAYLEQLNRLAGRHGFGFVDRKKQVRQARAAAAYLSAYFITGKREKATLHESAQNPHMPRQIVYVDRRLTTSTRCTMRTLRWRRYFHVQAGVALSWHELHRFACERDRTNEAIRELRTHLAAANAPPLIDAVPHAAA